MAHASEIPLLLRVVSSTRFAQTNGLLVAGNLTSASAGETAMQTANDAVTRHASTKHYIQQVKGCLISAGNLVAGSVTGSSFTTFYGSFPEIPSTANGASFN